MSLLTVRQTIRFEREHLAAIKVAAAATGVSTATFVRGSAMERAAGGRLAVFDMKERALIAQTTAELRRQGANLNQMAFAINKVAAGIGGTELLPQAPALEAAVDLARATISMLRDLLLPLADRLRIPDGAFPPVGKIGGRSVKKTG